jgi:signal transduction histidine kinase/CheY-like chemotaxis protein
VKDDEESRLRSVALQNAQSILAARQRADEELLAAKEALERKADELREETRLLDLLNRTGQAIASTLDQEQLLQLVTDAGTELSGASFGAFFYNVTDAQGDRLQLYVLSGAPRSAFENLGLPRATPIFGPTFRGEGPVRCDDVTEDPRYGKVGPHHGMPPGHLPVRSYLAVPVTSRSGETLGGLFFGHPERAVFTERSERLVVGVAAFAAVAVDNARLYEGARRAAEERAQLLDAERAARTELERVSRTKDEFLATLSHELRTPLNAVLGWSEILLTRVPDRDDIRQGLETIGRNARAQTQLIEDLLDMSRIMSGAVRLDVQRTQLGSVVDAAVDAVGPAAAAKQLRLRKIIDPNAGTVIGDPARLQQIVWNLLSNAVKFTPKGGRVEVVVERVGSQIEITVSDSGIGVEPEFLPHLFERFRQADASTTRNFGGLGIGLSIVKQLVELHGGTIRAESTGVDEGASFVVSLPVAILRQEVEREHPSAHIPVATRRGLTLSGLKIVIVDDEPDARDLLAMLLEDRQAEVFTAPSADEALALVRTHQPDVLVSDIGMPGKDGYAFIRDVRGLPRDGGGAVPAIALTAFARAEDRARAMLAGYQVHMAKPVEPEELIVTIASLGGQAPPSSG